MIYLHKILPAFFLPVSLILAVLIWALIAKSKLPVYLAFLMLWLASMPIASDNLFRQIESPMVRTDPTRMPNVDAVVVLSGMLGAVRSRSGFTTEWGDPDRFFGGVELMKAGKAGHLIFTGGTLPWLPESPPEGEVLKKFAADFGVDPKQILITGAVRNTEDEAIAVKAIAAKHGYQQIILVTSAFHMQRALASFEHQKIKVVPYPVDFKAGEALLTPMDFLPDAEALRNTQIAFRELMGRAFYYLKYNIL